MLWRRVDGLEKGSEAQQAYESGRAIHPQALYLALLGQDTETVAQVQAVPQWNDLLAPYPMNLQGAPLRAEMKRRLGAFVPVLAQLPTIPDRSPPAAGFLAAVRLLALDDEPRRGKRGGSTAT